MSAFNCQPSVFDKPGSFKKVLEILDWVTLAVIIFISGSIHHNDIVTSLIDLVFAGFIYNMTSRMVPRGLLTLGVAAAILFLCVTPREKPE